MSFKWNGAEIDKCANKVKFNGTDVTEVYFNGTSVWKAGCVFSVAWTSQTAAPKFDFTGGSMEYTNDSGNTWITVSSGTALPSGTGSYMIRELVEGQITSFGKSTRSSSLTTITGSVTAVKGKGLTSFNLSWMSNATSIDVSQLITNKITDMTSMFYHCESAQITGIENFVSSQVTNFNSMFQDCAAATTLNCRGLVGSSAVSTKYMFTSCDKLKNVTMTNWDTSNVTTFYYMFNGCFVLVSTLFPNPADIDLSSAVDFKGVFYHCLAYINGNMGAHIECNNITNIATLFAYSGVTHVNLNWTSTPAVQDIGSFASNCPSLVSAKLVGLYADTINKSYAVFKDSANLVCVDALCTTGSTDKREIFDGCTSLTSPNAVAQADIMDANGAWYFVACP